MFVPCPHCQFLVACPPQRRALLPADCPRCGRPLDGEPLASDAAVAGAQPTDGDTTQADHAAPGTGSGLLAFRGFAVPLIGKPPAVPAGTGDALSRRSDAQAAVLRALGAGDADAADAADADVPAQAPTETQAQATIEQVAIEQVAVEQPDATAMAEDAMDTDPAAAAQDDPGAGAVPETDADAAAPDRAAADDDATGADAATQAVNAEPGSVSEPAQNLAVAAAAAGPQPPAFAARANGTRWAWLRWLLVALLALLLGLQVLVADRARLAADPDWRPLLERLCGALGCTLPPWHEPGAFAMLDRQVRPASQPGALRVDAIFRNDARWAQDWPALELALSDADGRVLGSRVFEPAEYLGAAPTTQLSPGQSAQVTFLVQEPAPGTVAFSFGFR